MLTREAIKDLCLEHNLEMVVLFGSRGRRPDSDWDLALLPGHQKPDTSQVEESFVQKLQRDDLDFLWLHTAGPLASSQVARSGEPLYEREPTCFSRFQMSSQLRRDDQRLWTAANQAYVRRALEGNWTVDRDLVTRKLAQLARYILELTQILEASQAEFESDFRIHRVAERQIELLVECAASINSEVAQAVAQIPPSDYYSSFHSMAAAGWLDRDTAGRLANLAGLRNRLVHQYEDIRLPQLYKVSKASLPDWHTYLKSVSEHLVGD